MDLNIVYNAIYVFKYTLKCYFNICLIYPMINIKCTLTLNLTVYMLKILYEWYSNSISVIFII